MVELTGTTQYIEDLSASGSASITVPADAQIAILSSAYWANGVIDADGWTALNFDGSGMDFTLLGIGKAVDYPTAGHWIAQYTAHYMLSPPTGSVTFYWVNSGSGMNEGIAFALYFAKGIDMGSPIVSTQEFSSDRPGSIAVILSALTGVSANDLGALGVYDYSHTPDMDYTGYGQTALFERAAYHEAGHGVGYEVGEDALYAVGSWIVGVAFALRAASGLPIPPPGYEITKSMVLGMAIRSH